MTEGAGHGRSDDLDQRALVAIGQAELMMLYQTLFNKYGITCAQVGGVACAWGWGHMCSAQVGEGHVLR